MAQVIDPVCEMTVDTETAGLKSDYQGTTYYFCGAGCTRAFDKNPTEFVGAVGSEGGEGSNGSAHGHQA